MTRHPDFPTATDHEHVMSFTDHEPHTNPDAADGSVASCCASWCPSA